MGCQIRILVRGMNGEQLCFGIWANRLLLRLTKNSAPQNLVTLCTRDRRRLQLETVRAIIAAAQTYLFDEEQQLHRIIGELPAKKRDAAIKRWGLADRELSPIEHRRELLRLQKSLRGDEGVRRKLQDVRDGRISTKGALAHAWLPLSLQLVAHVGGITGLRGAVFEKWMARRPAKLRAAALAALDSRWFKDKRGRREEILITEYVAAIDKAYHGWTGSHLSTSSSVRSRRESSDVGHDLPGAGLTFALGCLRPLFPDITAASASHNIRNAREIRD